jgi:hypothetical protein
MERIYKNNIDEYIDEYIDELNEFELNKYSDNIVTYKKLFDKFDEININCNNILIKMILMINIILYEVIHEYIY